MSYDRFYCTTCCADRPIAGSKYVKVKRGNGFANIRRCSFCLERRKGTAQERDARSKQEVKEKRAAAVHAKMTSGKIDNE